MKKNWFDQICKAAILDMDGVISRTAQTHTLAWENTFNEFLKPYASREGIAYEPFTDEDYDLYVNGKSCYEGVKSFLSSRNLQIREGKPDDDADQESVFGLGNRKNKLFMQLLDEKGVNVYDDTVQCIKTWKQQGKKIAVVSTSNNCREVLEKAGLIQLFDAILDGKDAQLMNLKDIPAPDVFIKAAHMLQVSPSEAVVFEDAIAGIQAGHNGGFGMVVGVDRSHDADRMYDVGADMVINEVEKFSEMLKFQISKPKELPAAMEAVNEILQKKGDRQFLFFFDFDGTLAPISSDPDKVQMVEEISQQLRSLATKCSIAIVSGRERRDIEEKVNIPDIFYAGSHGFDIRGPKDVHHQHPDADKFFPALDRITERLRKQFKPFSKVKLERKTFALAVHYRGADQDTIRKVTKAVQHEVQQEELLKSEKGKSILEIKPNVDWHKGMAVKWIMKTLGYDEQSCLPVYLGDDTTDEDAFGVLQENGISILVEANARRTYAHYLLHDQVQVGQFLKLILPHV